MEEPANSGSVPTFKNKLALHAPCISLVQMSEAKNAAESCSLMKSPKAENEESKNSATNFWMELNQRKNIHAATHVMFSAS